MLSIPSGVGVWALIQLLQLPELPDCLSEFLSMDSAASVFYCATTIANEQDADKLYKAIVLINTLRTDDPQRPMGDRLIEQWSQTILNLGEIAFQQGDLDKAVDMVKQIPVNVPAHKLADNRIKQWKSIWSKAEAIYETAAAKMDEDSRDNWYLALSKAKELLKVGNDYWATTKYQELVHEIQDIKEKKEEWNKLAEDSRKAETTKEPETINQWELDQQTQDLAQLKKARILASSGKIEDMRDAINGASMIVSGRYYQEAQKLIATTNRQIEIADDRSSLKQAQQLASTNDVVSLQMAINEARLIANERPLYKEANEQIAKWTDKMSKLQAQIELKEKRVLENEKRTLGQNNSQLESQVDNSSDNSQLNEAHSEKVLELENSYLRSIEPQLNDQQVNNSQLNEASNSRSVP